MVIDGFKSYGQRTVIDGFDEAFNAITGLNGSGKSNILDAICFLLGITNLSHVSTEYICQRVLQCPMDSTHFFLNAQPGKRLSEEFKATTNISPLNLNLSFSSSFIRYVRLICKNWSIRTVRPES